MANITTLLSAAIVSFFAHHYGEKFFTRNWTREVRFVFRGYHIHHSVLGALSILVAIIFTSSVMTFIMIGYGLGNLWQHKQTHKALNEKGFVFISKIIK